MPTVKLLAIFAENRIGQLAHITGLLAQASLNIRWVTIASTEKFGVLKLLVDEPQIAFQQLKHNGVPVSLVDVLAIEVEDRPGGLHQVAQTLAENKVNIENASGFVAGGRAVLLIEVNDVAAGGKVLEKEGWRLLSAGEALRL